MALTKSGKLIGMAAHNARRDLMNEIHERQHNFSDRWNTAEDKLRNLMALDDFWTWWDSYPETMPKSEFLPIMEAKVKELESVSPLNARRDAILAAFKEEALTKAEGMALIDELAEIETKLNPVAMPEIDMDTIEEVPF